MSIDDHMVMAGQTVAAGTVMPEPPTVELEPGTRLGQYEVIRPLGRGGMSMVYLARDTRLARLAALKLLHTADGELGEQLLAEARATARLNHENIVTLFEICEHAGRSYLALEYVKGTSLADWFARWKDARPGGVPLRRALEIVIPVARALVCAHAARIVHRDLKPGNIILSDTGAVKIVDFGIARVGEPSAQDGEAEVVGTLPYMSPEQLIGVVDARTDLWAVGIILYELVTGHHPLAPITYEKLMATVGDFSTPLPSVRIERDDLGKLGPIIDRCLLKRREDRIQSAQELLDELESVAHVRRSADQVETCPFPGLMAFQEADAEIYFGRDDEIRQAVMRLASQSLLAVVGPSGAGKSSLVRAGLIPALKQSGDSWEAFVVRPGARPLSALLQCLVAGRPGTGLLLTQAEGPGEVAADSDRALEELRQRLLAEPGYLATKLRERARRRLQRVLLFVDQFEELYTLAAQAERDGFIRCLKGVLDDASSPLRLVLTIRSDFLDRLAEGAERLATPVSESMLLLGVMTPDGLRAAIERPLAAGGIRFETPAIPDDLVRALQDIPGALPLMQFAAGKLWQNRDPATGVIREETYRQLGGVAGTLARHADEVLRGLTTAEVELARQMLLRLVTPERTRAVVDGSELLEAFGGRGAEPERVLDSLIDGRLLVVHGGGQRGRVELVHDSLIDRWPQLGSWLREGEADAELLDRVRRASRDWDGGRRRSGLLWQGEAAAEAIRWLERRRGVGHPSLGPREEAYLTAVRALALREVRRRKRWVTGGFAFLVSVALALTYLGLQARRAESTAQEEATRARDATRMAALEKWRGNPTMRLAILRDVEAAQPPSRWELEMRNALHEPLAALVLVGHTGIVTSSAFSPDGRHIALTSHDKTVRVWTLDGRPPRVFQGHEGLVISVAYSQDGEHIATASYDGTVRVWRADGEGEPVILRGPAGGVVDARFSPDGRHIVAAHGDRVVRIWRADGHGAPLELSGHTQPVTSVDFGHDGQHVVSASADQTVRVWRTDGQGAPIVLTGHAGGVNSVGFSPDGQRVVSGSDDQTVRVWRADGSGEPLVLTGHQGSVSSVAFSPDGARIVSASDDRTLRIWPADGGGAPLVLAGHEGLVTSSSFSADGVWVVSTSDDQTVRVWSSRRRAEPTVIEGHGGLVTSVAVSPDGRSVVATSRDKRARVWRLDGEGEPLTLAGHEASLNSASYSPDGQHIVTGSNDKTIRVWRADGQGEPIVLTGHIAAVNSVAYSPDGQHIVSASADRTVRVWRADGQGKPVMLLGHGDMVIQASFSPDGKSIASFSYDHTVRIWPADGSGNPIVLAGHAEPVYGGGWSPDGRHVVSASLDKTLRVWDADGRGEPIVLAGHDGIVMSATYTPDGRHIVSGSYDRTVRVWPADGRGEPVVLTGHAGVVTFVGTSLDGQLIVSASEDETVRIWHDFAPIRPTDERVWNATNYCFTVEQYGRYLDLGRNVAQERRDHCLGRVRDNDSLR